MNQDDLDNDLISGHIPFTIGLVNPTSTTCFTNSIIQCLFPIKDMVLSLCAYNLHSVFRLYLPPNIHILSNFSNLIISNYNNRQVDSKRIINSLINCIQTRNQMFPAKQQHDSHSFMVFLFEWLLEELNILHEIITLQSESPLDFRIPNEIPLTPTRHEITYAYNFIESNLFTVIKQTIQCSICKNKTITTEKQIISLPITSANSINGLLANYFRQETLSTLNNNAFKCENCDSLVTATKSIKISKLPRVLIIHLNIFDQYVCFLYINFKKNLFYINL